MDTMNKISWPLMRNNITHEDLKEVINYLNQPDPILTNGPKVQQFEQAWSKWLGVKYSVMVNSGSSANDLTMIALREIYGTGEIIVPPLTWVSDIAAVINAGFKPIFADINMRTLAIDADKTLNLINPKTKAVFLTHVLGLNGLTNKLVEKLLGLNIPLIEDVCESHGATHEGKKLGTFGLASNFSFYYAHHLTTIEGGMVCTDNFDLYEMLRMLRAHGMVREASKKSTRDHFVSQNPTLNKDFIFAYAAHNMRPNEINGIIGLSQLKRLNDGILSRRNNFEKFMSLLDSEKFFTDFAMEGNSNYAFILILREPNFSIRDKIEKNLTESGIEFRRGLSGGGNQLRQPYLQKIEGIAKAEQFPNVEHVHNFGWYIGNYPYIEDDFFSDFSKAISGL